MSCEEEEEEEEDELEEETDNNSNTECNFTTFSGNTNCGDGFVAVNDNYCCPSDFPFWFVGTDSCYSTCEEAQNAGASQIIKGNNGSGSNGTSCDWTRGVNFLSVSAEIGTR